MGKKVKTAILLLTLYLLVFWIGFKSGGSYVRMKRLDIERIEMPTIETFYIVERTGRGTWKDITFQAVNSGDVLIRLFMNEKLRPLLKYRDIEIYKETGERVY